MKTVVAVFAHPDDEAFGPGGTIALLCQDHEVHIITVTGGEEGKCSIDKHHESLSKIRRQELLESAKILGVKKVHFLGYKDGMLSNHYYHEIASKIEEKLKEIKPEILLTFEMRGVSGHLDHVAVSFITTYVFKRMTMIKELLYYFITPAQSKPSEDNYFIHFPKGFASSLADRVYDTSSVWETKIKAMKAHKSQEHDAKRIIKTLKTIPKKEHFFITHN